jgi:hypothetical protein
VDGVTLHMHRPGHAEMHAAVSTTWPGGAAPSFLAALALSEDPRIERAPRIPGESREESVEWTIVSAPLWAGRDLIGTIRLHRRGQLPPPGQSPELEHLVAFAAHLARTLHRVQLMDELRMQSRAEA